MTPLPPLYVRPGQFATVEDLSQSLKNLPDQRECSVREPVPGYPTVELFAVHIMPRTEDGQAFSKMVVASEMAEKIQTVMQDHDGPIYWRVPIETEIVPVSFVEKHTPDGSHRDPMTDQRYTPRSGEYLAVKAYCRLVRVPKSADIEAAA